MVSSLLPLLQAIHYGCWAHACLRMCVRARTCVHAALRKQREALKDLWRRRDKLKDTETAEMGSPWRQWTVFLKGLSLLHCCCCFFFFLFGDWRLSPYSTYGEGGEVRRCRTWSTGLWVSVSFPLSPFFLMLFFVWALLSVYFEADMCESVFEDMLALQL